MIIIIIEVIHIIIVETCTFATIIKSLGKTENDNVLPNNDKDTICTDGKKSTITDEEKHCSNKVLYFI